MSRRDERGSATPFAVACLGLLLLLAAALGVVAAMVHAHRRRAGRGRPGGAGRRRGRWRGADGCAAGGRIAGPTAPRSCPATFAGREVAAHASRSPGRAGWVRRPTWRRGAGRTGGERGAGAFGRCRSSRALGLVPVQLLGELAELLAPRGAGAGSRLVPHLVMAKPQGSRRRCRDR